MDKGRQLRRRFRPGGQRCAADWVADQFDDSEQAVATANVAVGAMMMVEIYGPYAKYQTKTDRQIPVVVLKPV